MPNLDLVTLKPNPKTKKGYKIDYAEAYRSLRTNLEFSSFNQELQVIALTSASKEEGKSTTSANLAVVMANHDERVLLIDCDFRLPSQHRIFKLSNQIGLSSALLDFESKDFNITKHMYLIEHSQIKNKLFVMPSGPIVPNPSEVLSSKRFFAMIKYLRPYFDRIIIDSPPVLPVSETIPIGIQADGVLFCVASEQTKKDHAKEAVSRLQRANVNLIGSIVTMLKEPSSGYYNNYYGREATKRKKK
jgi:capsular exopolysaccharide synthesis family protein